MGKKRGNGEGSIYLAAGSWCAAVTVGNKRIVRRTDSRERAVMKLAELKRTFAERLDDLHKATVEQLARAWLASLDVLAATRSKYRAAILQIGELAIERASAVTPLMIDNWLVNLKSRLDRNAVQDVAHVVKRSLAYAVTMNVIRDSPFHSRVPTRRRKVITPFTEDETRRILHACESNRYEGAVVLAFCCSMRQGEVFGLQWQDVDFANARLSIIRQCVETDGTLDIRAPKTASNVRTIIVASVAMQALQRRLTAARDEGLDQPGDFVFATRRGASVRRSNFNRRFWTPLLLGLGIRHRGLHHGRHTAASLMLRDGVSIVEIAAILGHVSPKITLEFYSHLMGGAGEAAAASMDRLFCKSPASSMLAADQDPEARASAPGNSDFHQSAAEYEI